MPIQQWSETIWVVKLGDEPALSEELTTLRVQLERNGRIPSLVIDISGVDHLNSSNLSGLLRLRKMTIDGEAKLRIVSPRDSTWAVFLVTGLDKVFHFAPDVSTALAGLQLGR